MKKIIISLSIIGVVAMLAIGGTVAYFTDTETSTGNTFTAGAIDLKIDSTCHYNGKVCVVAPQGGGHVWEGTSEPCFCTWDLKDLGQGDVFFNLNDIKPGDSGEDTVSLHVDSNPAWVCAEMNNLVDQENNCNSPEAKVDSTCGIPGVGEGELSGNLYLTIWEDNGEGGGVSCDNIKNGTEKVLVENAKASQAMFPIADSLHGSGPITEGCIGIAWNVPSTVGNEIQGDSITADFVFKAYQARHNDSFTCSPVDGCFDQADMMLILDRSSSIDATEMAQLKTASLAFMTGLNPDGGAHMGQTSFGTNGSFDLHLTGNQFDISNAINSLTAVDGQWTNLYEAINLAKNELDNSNTTYERPLVPDYMVIVTDGLPNRPTDETTAQAMALAEANAARAAGISIYVVGIGDGLDATYLKQIADNDAHYFNVVDYSQLESLLKNIATCEPQPE